MYRIIEARSPQRGAGPKMTPGSTVFMPEIVLPVLTAPILQGRVN